MKNWIIKQLNILRSFKNNDDLFPGAILPSEEELADMPQLSELVATVAPVKWKELIVNNIPKYSVYSQNGSGSCVAMSIALIATILYKIRTGIDIMFSASWVYRQRINQDSGMIGTDAFRIASNGLLPEVLMPSQDLTEGQINNVPVQSWFKKVAEVFALDDKFVQLPIKNIETVASVMQVTGKPVMVWFESTYSEWKTIPEISPNFINPFRHSVTAIDYGIYQGEKAIVIQESWGFKSTQLGAIRIIKESYFNKRNIFSAYPRRFKFDITNDRPVYDGTIISFQRCMKSIGLFPVGVDFIERFGPTTKRACEQFQVLHNLTVSGIIDSETESKLKTLFN